MYKSLKAFTLDTSVVADPVQKCYSSIWTSVFRLNEGKFREINIYLKAKKPLLHMTYVGFIDDVSYYIISYLL